MAIDRRRLLIGGGMLMASACARAQPPRPAGPAGKALWEAYKTAFLDPTGRIIDTGNGGISHSEGQGYGLMFALWCDDRASFVRMLEWTEAVLARKDQALFSWRYDPRHNPPVGDPNNATDGDIFIAWALAEAAYRWGAKDYATRSAQIRAAIRNSLVVDRYDRSMLLPALNGFVTPHAVTINPSYYVWPALDVFRRIDGADVWGKVIADGTALIGNARFGPMALPTDWVEVTSGGVAPAPAWPPRFGFDALRAPLYAVTGKKAKLAAPVTKAWRGYAKAGTPIPAWIDVVTGETAPFPLSPGGNAIAGRLLGNKAREPLSGDYYAASLQLLAALLP